MSWGDGRGGGGRHQLLFYIIQQKEIGFNPFLCGPGCEPRYVTVNVG
jgi:hypothetical protein